MMEKFKFVKGDSVTQTCSSLHTNLFPNKCSWFWYSLNKLWHFMTWRNLSDIHKKPQRTKRNITPWCEQKIMLKRKKRSHSRHPSTDNYKLALSLPNLCVCWWEKSLITFVMFLFSLFFSSTPEKKQRNWGKIFIKNSKKMSGKKAMIKNLKINPKHNVRSAY